MCGIGTGDQRIPLRIRPADLKDLDNVVSLGSKEFDYLEHPVEFFHDRILKAYFFVAELDGEFVGFIDIEPENEFVAKIMGIAVKDEFRRRGIGSELMEFGLRFLRTLGFSKVFLLSKADNTPANELYRKFGFVPISQHKGIITWARDL